MVSPEDWRSTQVQVSYRFIHQIGFWSEFSNFVPAGANLYLHIARWIRSWLFHCKFWIFSTTVEQLTLLHNATANIFSERNRKEKNCLKKKVITCFLHSYKSWMKLPMWDLRRFIFHIRLLNNLGKRGKSFLAHLFFTLTPPTNQTENNPRQEPLPPAFYYQATFIHSQCSAANSTVDGISFKCTRASVRWMTINPAMVK